MAATNLADLHNFEVHFESAAETFLNTATGISCVGTISTSALTSPRVELALQLDEGTPPPIAHGDGAEPNTIDFSSYDATFVARLLTDNAVGQSASHALYRSQIRVAMLFSADNWDDTTLPYYGIKWLQPSNCSYLTDDDFNVTELSWVVRFEIRQDAWPE